MSFDRNEAPHEEDRAVMSEFRAQELEQAREDVLHASYDCGYSTEDDTELTEEIIRKVAYGLAEGMKKRAGAWPTPEVAKLQRAWDSLVRLDDGASKADTVANREVNAERGQELPFCDGPGGAL